MTIAGSLASQRYDGNSRKATQDPGILTCNSVLDRGANRELRDQKIRYVWCGDHPVQDLAVLPLRHLWAQGFRNYKPLKHLGRGERDEVLRSPPCYAHHQEKPDSEETSAATITRTCERKQKEKKRYHPKPNPLRILCHRRRQRKPVEYLS